MNSGLYDGLIETGLMVPHTEASLDLAVSPEAYKVIRPERLSFTSYPYEWCFSELKAAALTTLEIQESALRFGMSLKDASAYNMQFISVVPVLIDTLSFQFYEEGKPWVAYRQFCQHFLGPLALIAYTDARLSQLLKVHIDGIPIDLASALLPLRTRIIPSLYLNIHMHARMQKRYSTKGAPAIIPERKMSRAAMQGLISSLYSAVARMEWKVGAAAWSGYEEENSYAPEAMDQKERIVSEFLDQTHSNMVWDLGANTGRFSRISAAKGFFTVAWDAEPECVEINYRKALENNEPDLLPLVLDLSNPTPGVGWEGKERMSLAERSDADTVMALALVHHLAISDNMPLDRLARFFSGICRWLLIEFVPKSDPMVVHLLSTREDIFPNYDVEGFEKAFRRHFTVTERRKLAGSERILYLMESRRID